MRGRRRSSSSSWTRPRSALPPWVIPALLAVTVFALVYLRFLFALPNRFRWLFILAAVLYVGGAAGLQMLRLALQISAVPSKSG